MLTVRNKPEIKVKSETYNTIVLYVSGEIDDFMIPNLPYGNKKNSEKIPY